MHYDGYGVAIFVYTEAYGFCEALLHQPLGNRRFEFEFRASNEPHKPPHEGQSNYFLFDL